MTVPFAHHDLPEEKYPFRIEFYRADTSEVVFQTEVTGPTILEVPPLGRELGVEIKVRLSFADGEVVDS